MALRRCRTTENNLLDYIPKGITMLPNTSGARNAEEAVRIARLAREVCQTDFVKVEIEHESKYLLPDNEETIKATEKLAKEGFVVMPYMFPDPIAAKRLEDAGAALVGHHDDSQLFDGLLRNLLFSHTFHSCTGPQPHIGHVRYGAEHGHNPRQIRTEPCTARTCLP